MCKERRFVGLALSCALLASVYSISNTSDIVENVKQAQDTIVPDIYPILHSTFDRDEQEAIRNEIFYGEIELLAQLIQAEAGNQDELGKRYVADVVLNRVDSKDFSDTIEDVIFQIDPVQFATTVNGAMGKAGYTVTEEDFQIALEERESRTNSEIMYFRADKYSDSGTPAFKYGDHYFSTK